MGRDEAKAQDPPPRRGRGRQKSPTKENISMRLDADLAEYFRGTGKGWQTRLNQMLREAVFGRNRE